MSAGARAAAARQSLARLASQLPRDKADTLLLLAAALLVLAPHAEHLPLWVSATCAATLAWRATLTLRGTRLPPRALLMVLASASMAAVYASFHTLLGRDAGVAMLVLLVAFKMLEMHARRDLFVVVFLCLFLVLTNFFYAQGIGTALLMTASVVVLFGAQISFQFASGAPPLWRRLWLSARMCALAMPLTLLLFLVFPRLQGPLWGLPGDAHGGRSGMSDSMTPGNLSSLALSEETAFRVRFLDPAPAQSQLYWRGVVLGEFDGRTWTRVRAGARGAARTIEVSARGRPIHYQLTLEPSGQRWLFALEMARQLPQLEGNPSTISPELEISSATPIEQRVRYEATAQPDFTLQAGAALDDAARWLALPAGFNRRSVALGLALRAEPDPGARVAAVLRRFRHDAYSYTLEPPLLGTDAVDDFLFSTKAGFCEHYAGAFVVLMRAAGVPARVVTGYQGGEANPVDGYLTVRQSDAHAWAEVWLAARGWVRVDPTAAVAPERVERNLARALPRTPPFGLPGLDFALNGPAWLGQLRFGLAAITNGWNQWVLDYNPERQRGLLATLSAALTGPRLLAALALAALLLLLRQLRERRRRGDPVDAVYLSLCRQLARRGMPRAGDEGPSAYAKRLAQLPLSAPQQAAVQRFLRLYSAYKYSAERPDPALVATLKRCLTGF
jgi:transglutaminase-like putative cysteine protease